MAAHTAEPTRWALLIGIDQYPRLPESWQLSGCANDVETMAQLLIDRFGFPGEQVIKLVDVAAKRADILAAIDSLVARVGRGDCVVVHYSGHGSQAPSLDPDEVDGQDETILPHDAVRDSDPPVDLDIHDKQIHAWLERLTAVTENVTLIFDSCHSGGVTREAGGARARWVPADRRLMARRASVPRMRSASQRSREVGPSGWVPLGQRYVLIAGCQSSECSCELTAPAAGVQHGALTYFLGQELLGAGTDTTYRDVFEAAAARVTGNWSLQHPQLEGEGDRRLFGLDRIEPMRFVLVRERVGQQVRLGAGQAMGVAKGSTWAVYPPGTKQVDGKAPLGTLEITDTRGVTSSAEVRSETRSGAVAAGARAVELTHEYGDLTLAVRMAEPGRRDPAARELASLIAASQVLRPASDGEAAGATVHLLAPRGQARADDPVPQVVDLDSPTWAVVGAGRELILPLCPAGGDAVRRLYDNLVRRARYRVAWAIENPLSPLRDSVDLVLLRQGADGEWTTAQADQGGLPGFVEGENLAFELSNRSAVQLFLYVLDFGLSGRIGPVYPFPGIDEALPPGRSVRIGTRPGEEIELFIPSELPFLRNSPRAAAAGQETLKLIATTRKTDFFQIYQDGYRGEPIRRGPLSSLVHLLDMTAGGATRDSRPKAGGDGDDDWTTRTRSFWLRPRDVELPPDRVDPRVLP